MQCFDFPLPIVRLLLIGELFHLFESILVERSSTVIHPWRMCCIVMFCHSPLFDGEWRVLIMFVAESKRVLPSSQVVVPKIERLRLLP